MCGILGVIDKNGIGRYDADALRNVQQHRGPDSWGVYKDERALLVHNRLSILDLSDNASQPFTSSNGKYVAIYNGEVYNFQEIANEIRMYYGDMHYQFRSSSDTEIIVEGFQIWGIGILEKLNGMFSVAIYEKDSGKLYLFRDRIGIKPLFYSFFDNAFYFASELKGVTAMVQKKLTLNSQAIGLFLHFGYIPPPFTIYNEIFKLVPGEYLIFENGHIHKEKYWDISQAIKKEVIVDETEALVKITDLLKSSVHYQLISDVPVGIFLSGGIDSSLITALACNSGGVKPNTFTIGFEENKYDESKYAAKIAQHLGTNHNEYILSYKNAIDYIDIFLDTYDEPYADSSGIPTLIVSKLAREKVKVALSGEGGDELFLGYGTYTWANRLNNPLLYYSRGMIGSLLNRFPSNRYKRAAQYFDFTSDQVLPFHIFSAEQNMFPQKDIAKLTGKPLDTLLLEKYLDFGGLPRKLNPIEQQSLFDLMFYLPGDLLTKMDRASMRYSLEARVPFLDHRLVETAINIDTSLRLKLFEKKYLLKKILFQHIPASLFDRPKQGFAIPLEKWMKNELEEKVKDQLALLSNGTININTEVIEKLLKEFYSGQKPFSYNKLWLLYVLSKWLEKHKHHFIS